MKWLLVLIFAAWCFYQVSTCSTPDQSPPVAETILTEQIHKESSKLHNSFKAIPDARVVGGIVSVPAFMINCYQISDGAGGVFVVKAMSGQPLPEAGDMLFLTGVFKNVFNVEGTELTVFCEHSRKVLEEGS